MNKNILFLILLFFCTSRIYSQPYQRSWLQSYGNDSAQAKFDVIKTAVDSHDNLFVLSRRDTSSHDACIFLTKYDSAGVRQWDKYYLNPNQNLNPYYSTWFYDVVPVDLSIDLNDNVIIGGHLITQFQGYNYLILKYDNNGNLLWQRDVDGPISEEDKLVAVRIDAAGNIFVTGNTLISGDPYYFQDVMTCKLDPGGNLIWKTYLDYPFNISVYNDATLAALDSNSNIIVVGYWGGREIRKIDSTGLIIWRKPYQLYQVNSVIAGENDNTYLAGWSYSSALLEKLDNNGDSLRMLQTSGAYSTLTDLIFRNNTIYATGFTGSTPSSGLTLMTDTTFQTVQLDSISVLNMNVSGKQIFEKGGKFTVAGVASDTLSHNELFAARYNSNLQRIWTYNYTDSLNHNTSFVHSASDSRGDLNIGSAFYTTDNTYAVFNVDSNGTNIWHDIRINYQSLYDAGKYITLDHSGNIIVWGISGPNNSGAIILKYDPSGNLIWKYLNNTLPGFGFPKQMLTDNNDNIYFTGFTQDGPILSCLDGAGIPKYYNFDSTAQQFGYITLDPIRNVYVLATVPSLPYGWHVNLIKVDSVGNIIWNKLVSDSSTTDGTENIFYTNSNHIYAIFNSYANPDFQNDFAVYKLDTSGNIIWKRIFNSALSQFDGVIKSTIDINENIIIAGRSDSINQETMIVKYDSSGNFLWRHRFENLNNGNNYPTDITTDSDGNIYLTGTMDSLGHPNNLTSMISPDGNVKWSKSFAGAIFSLLFDRDNLIMTGTIQNSFWGTDLLFCVSDTNGNLIYTDSIAPTGGGYGNYGQDIIGDGLGCYYVTGSTDSHLKMSEIATLKYCNSTVGITNPKLNNEVFIYPVPATNMIHLISKDRIIDGYKIFSIDGKLLVSGSTKDNSIDISLSLQTGIYILKVFCGQDVYTNKFSLLEDR